MNSHLDTMELLMLIHIFVLGIPMVVVSIFLLIITVRIRGFLEKYNIQRTIFKGILLVGYIFVLIAVMHLLEEILDWYSYPILSLEVGALWHGATLVVLVIISLSFYGYLKSLRSSEKATTP